jgi:hypothetical protein
MLSRDKRLGKCGYKPILVGFSASRGDKHPNPLVKPGLSIFTLGIKSSDLSRMIIILLRNKSYEEDKNKLIFYSLDSILFVWKKFIVINIRSFLFSVKLNKKSRVFEAIILTINDYYY